MTILVAVIIIIILSLIFGEEPENNTSKNNTNVPTDEIDTADSELAKIKLDTIESISEKAINSSSDGGSCYAEYIEPDESQFTSIASMGTSAMYYFVKSADKAFESDACDQSYTFVYSINGDSSNGDTEKFALGIFKLDRNQYDKYKWAELSGKSVGAKLRDDQVLSIPANVDSKIDYKDFRYNG